MIVEIGTEAAQFPEKGDKNGIFLAVHFTGRFADRSLSSQTYLAYTAKILYLKFGTYIPRRNFTATVPIPTLMFLCAIYIFPQSVFLFCCRKIGGPIVGIYKSRKDI
jgi:hypothetical protein